MTRERERWYDVGEGRRECLTASGVSMAVSQDFARRGDRWAWTFWHKTISAQGEVTYATPRPAMLACRRAVRLLGLS